VDHSPTAAARAAAAEAGVTACRPRRGRQGHADTFQLHIRGLWPHSRNATRCGLPVVARLRGGRGGDGGAGDGGPRRQRREEVGGPSRRGQ
jgi:hypothetical protein